MDFNELRELLTVINQTDIAEFTLKSGDFELVLRKSTTTDRQPALAAPEASVAAAMPTLLASPPLSLVPPSAPPRLADRFIDIISPMVGTFYRSPAPDESPFVETGERIRLGQTVCIIEAMKLMNEIESEVMGEIVEILVSNGEPVEYGQVLMRVNPT